MLLITNMMQVLEGSEDVGKKCLTAILLRGEGNRVMKLAVRNSMSY